MAVTRDVQKTIEERIQNDPEFAAALLSEVIALFQNDEPEIARLILLDLVRPEKFIKLPKPSVSHFINEPKTLL
ncbi:MAG: hypothetical protein H6655_11290 [Ardenticatenaceae bacterium]|nr:hypothetical protein [Ardenticatenaceae bacterium]